MTKTIREFMDESQPVTRWKIAKVFIMGMLMGAALATVFMWSAVLV